MYVHRMTKHPDRLLTAREAAAILGIQPNALSWRRIRGELALPSVRLGYRTVRYRLADLVLVVSGARPFLKRPGEPGWVSDTEEK